MESSPERGSKGGMPDKSYTIISKSNTQEGLGGLGGQLMQRNSTYEID